MSQAKNNVCIIDINGEDPITDKLSLEELQIYQDPHGKSKVKIILFRRNIYHWTDLEQIYSIFDQVRPVVLHLEFLLPENPLTPKNIGKYLKLSQRKIWMEDLFV